MRINHLYLAVTADRYELPISVRDTAAELATALGYTEAGIYAAISRPKTGELRGFNMFKTKDDEQPVLHSVARSLAKSTGLTEDEVQRAAKAVPHIKGRDELEAYLYCYKMARLTPPKAPFGRQRCARPCAWRLDGSAYCVAPVCWREVLRR